jgi:hypothetical protein
VGVLSRRAVLLAALVCFGGLSSSALASPGHKAFQPRIGNAMGLVPPVPDQGKKNFEPNESGIYTAVTYHGGPTMAGGVTVHSIFWAPPGYSFQPSPGAGIPSYEGLVQQYLTDVATASTGTLGSACTGVSCNVFTVEPQFSWGTAPGSVTHGNYTISYSTGTDSVNDTHPYPAGGCTSPEDTKACVTDQQVQNEVDRLIQSTAGTPRGLTNLWYVYLPPNVDECIAPGVCETTAYGGYHSLSDVGHGLTIYAFTGDPLVETDGVYSAPHPEGNPDAEVTADITAHEVNEAMSDPTGVGYLDPDGWEIGDKCEFGPQRGNPLGFVGGQPYNQVVNGHKYWTQEMWSNADSGCVQGTSNTSSPLPLPQVNLTQFSSTVSGNTEKSTAGVHVTVKLVRAAPSGNAVTVATATGTTAANGSWSATLPGGHAVGDDRDQVVVNYAGAGSPHNETILTGNGGDPFTESGWTGWTALDEGVALTNNDPAFSHGPSLSIAPCFQTGVLTYTGASGPEPATNFCGTASGVADTPLSAPVGPGAHVTVSSNDNRAFAGGDLPGGGNPAGGLVSLKIPVGEADSAPNFAGDFPPFTPTGFPTCTADLGAQAVGCSGLVPGRSYTLTNGSVSTHGTAGQAGSVTKHMTVRGGDTVALANSARTLTTLHVAHLRVDIVGDSASVASGSCSPDQYWGGPLASAPVSALAGEPTAEFGGTALTGAICPPSGRAFGLPTDSLAQTDERSGGQTVTEVADVANTSPLDGETMYGSFTAMALASDGGSRISLRIAPAGGGAAKFSASNVATSRGVSVKGLRPGNYLATWTVHDPNGDTRTVTTHFIEQSGTRGPRGPRGRPGPTPHVHCKLVGHKHRRIVCHVSFAKKANAHGELRMRIAQGRSVAALGHARLHGGSATVSMRQLRPLRGRSWWMTFVVHVGSQRSARTVKTRLLVF